MIRLPTDTTVTINLGTRGVLGVGASGVLGDSRNVITLNNGGTLANMYNPATTGSWPSFDSPVIDNPIVLTGAAGGVVRAGYTGSLTLNGVISEAGGLTKTDGSFVVLTADNTYQGGTTQQVRCILVMVALRAVFRPRV